MKATDRWSESDLLAADARTPAYPPVDVVHGMTLTHTASNTVGTVAGFSEGDQVVLVDRWGTKQLFRAHDGAFTHNGMRVALRSGASPAAGPSTTASGSIAAPDARAQVARASRIWVEGIHDAELLEKVWGDDLRSAAIVVEPLHGADDLLEAIRRFEPSAERRLGVLLDHLVDGSKEQRIADAVHHPGVLVSGHPFVDVWEAINPKLIGLEVWPVVPMGTPWKEGVLDVLGVDTTTGEFWRSVLDRVATWTDLATPLVNAVERLIDFVAEPIE